MSKGLPPGIAVKMELGMRFMKWAQDLRRSPNVDEVMAEFSVCRASAYRYLMAYRNLIDVFNARNAA